MKVVIVSWKIISVKNGKGCDNMKRFIILIILLITLIPSIVFAEECNIEKLTIESIKINTKTDNVIEKSEPIINGRNINLDLKMSEVGDSIEYEMIVKNDSNEDYELDKTTLSANSDYIEYTFDTNSDSNIVKKGETKKVILKVSYKNEVAANLFQNGIYTDNKKLTVNLTNNSINTNTSNNINNPNTGWIKSIYVLLFIIMIITIIGLTILKKKKYSKLMLLLLSLLIIPITTKAICKYDINVDSKVEIEKINKFYLDLECNNNYITPQSLNDKLPIELKYTDGMTWDDYMNSYLFQQIDSEVQQLIVESFHPIETKLLFEPIEQERCVEEATTLSEESACKFIYYPTIFHYNSSMKIYDISKGKYYSTIYCRE